MGANHRNLIDESTFFPPINCDRSQLPASVAKSLEDFAGHLQVPPLPTSQSYVQILLNMYWNNKKGNSIAQNYTNSKEVFPVFRPNLGNQAVILLQMLTLFIDPF
jgi:hypothetical protein